MADRVEEDVAISSKKEEMMFLERLRKKLGTVGPV